MMPIRNADQQESWPWTSLVLLPTGCRPTGCKRHRLMRIGNRRQNSAIAVEDVETSTGTCGCRRIPAAGTGLSNGAPAIKVRCFRAFGAISQELDQWSTVHVPKPNWRREPSAVRNVASWWQEGCAAKRATRYRRRPEVVCAQVQFTAKSALPAGRLHAPEYCGFRMGVAELVKVPT